MADLSNYKSPFVTLKTAKQGYTGKGRGRTVRILAAAEGGFVVDMITQNRGSTRMTKAEKFFVPASALPCA